MNKFHVMKVSEKSNSQLGRWMREIAVKVYGARKVENNNGISIMDIFKRDGYKTEDLKAYTKLINFHWSKMLFYLIGF